MPPTTDPTAITLKHKVAAVAAELYHGGITYQEAVSAMKREFMVTALECHRGNQSKAANALGMHRNTVSRLTDELGISTRQIAAEARRRPKPVRQHDQVAQSA